MEKSWKKRRQKVKKQRRENNLRVALQGRVHWLTAPGTSESVTLIYRMKNKSKINLAISIA
jgi:hypothetical protein